MTHSPEPWKVLKEGLSISDDGSRRIALACILDTGDLSDSGFANAKRIVLCVNALKDLPNDAIEGGWTAKGMAEYAKSLEQNQHDLVECLLRILVMAQAAGDESEKDSHNPYKAFLYEAGRLVRKCGTPEQQRILADDQ